jgi:hypothetical protein
MKPLSGLIKFLSYKKLIGAKNLILRNLNIVIFLNIITFFHYWHENIFPKTDLIDFYSIHICRIVNKAILKI